MTSTPPILGPRPITSREHALFRTLVEDSLGIHLSDAKRGLISARLGARVRELGLHTFEEYFDLATRRDRTELAHLFDSICTNETAFFREGRHFELLASTVVPRWIEEAEAGVRPRKIRVWSAGCSTGEEPYSVAMALLDRLRPDRGWSVHVTATDVSTRALARAREACYRMDRIGQIPVRYHKRFLLRGVGSRAGLFRIGPEIRRLVSFAPANLLEVPTTTTRSFDLLLCRNVLIYFRPETRTRVLRALCSHLVDGGLFFVGHAETMHGVTEDVRVVTPTAYQVTRLEPSGHG